MDEGAWRSPHYTGHRHSEKRTRKYSNQMKTKKLNQMHFRMPELPHPSVFSFSGRNRGSPEGDFSLVVRNRQDVSSGREGQVVNRGLAVLL